MGFVNLSYFLGRLNPFENDPTPRIEDEDFDLFLANTAVRASTSLAASVSQKTA